VIEERLEEVFTLFPILKNRANQVAETMSGGEQQMCAIARGLMSKPKLLMLDELSLGLMPSLVEKVLETVVEINRKGTKILLVEQMVQEALEIATRGYVIQTGRIVQEGTARELLESDSVRKAYMGM
jgi:branched-chain amino acid transport system ATP-binding protein